MPERCTLKYNFLHLYGNQDSRQLNRLLHSALIYWPLPFCCYELCPRQACSDGSLLFRQKTPKYLQSDHNWEKKAPETCREQVSIRENRLRYLCVRRGIGKYSGDTLGVKEPTWGSQQHNSIPAIPPGIPAFPPAFQHSPWLGKQVCRQAAPRLSWSAASSAQAPFSWHSEWESLLCLPRGISLWLLKAQVSYFKREEAFVVPSLAKTYPGTSGLLQTPIFVLQLLIILMVNGH